jgi:hypothetical protein
MASVYFDRKYAPVGFLIVEKGGDPYADETLLIDSDWDFPGVACGMGWQPCLCGRTDGTVDCKGCNRTASDMIAEAYDFIEAHQDEEFPALNEHIPLASV